MASSSTKRVMSDRVKWIIYGALGFLIFLILLVVVFGTPSAESVFRDMNEKMLETKTVTITQKLNMDTVESGSVEVNSKLFMNFASHKELLSKGDFSIDISQSVSPMSIGGDLINIGDSTYVKYSKLTSTDAQIAASFSPMFSKLYGNWIKVRDNDQFASFAKMPVKFLSGVLPTPYANLDNVQRKDVLAMLRDDSMYTIDESAKVDTSGVSAYKYSLNYNKDQYKKVAKAIAGYVSYFKFDDTSDSEIKSLTVWVNIDTKQIVKLEFIGTSSGSQISGTIEFSDYGKEQTVEKPADYFIESELLN